MRAVQTLDAIIRDAESVVAPPLAPAPPLPGPMPARALSEAAAALARAGEVDAIVAITREGATPRLLARGLLFTAAIYAYGAAALAVNRITS